MYQKYNGFTRTKKSLIRQLAEGFFVHHFRLLFSLFLSFRLWFVDFVYNAVL